MKKILFFATPLIVALVTSEGHQALVSAQRDDQKQFVIGIVRGDATILPFAQYGNGGWWNPWPKPRQADESIYAENAQPMPHSLADLPEPWFTRPSVTVVIRK